MEIWKTELKLKELKHLANYTGVGESSAWGRTTGPNTCDEQYIRVLECNIMVHLMLDDT